MTIEEQVVELRHATIGMKSELLEIKEYLADNKEKMNDVTKSFEKSSIIINEKVDGVRNELIQMIKDSTPKIDLSDYVTYDYLVSNYFNKGVIKQFVDESTSNVIKKSELYKLIPIKDYATINYVDEKVAKLSDISLDGYVKEDAYNRGLNNLSATIYRYIPEAIEKYRKDNHLATEPYVKENFVAKNDIGKYVRDLVEDVDLEGYAKASDLAKYVSKSEFGTYVEKDKYDFDILSINSSIKNINNSLGNFVTKSQIGSLMTKDDINGIIDDSNFVTKEYLVEELSKINVGCDIDASSFLTVKDYDNLKKYVDSSLSAYPSFGDVYKREDINTYFAKKEDIINDFYTKSESNTKFLTKNDAAGTYITLVDAYGEFLSKEDYRGIKDAMTLNAGYKNAPEIFNLLLESGKILDGFYIIGDSVVMVKDGKKYSTNLTGSNSYTRNEIDEMFNSKIGECKAKNWRMDTGGNY